MGERTVDELEALVGTTRQTVSGLRVEPGKVAEFARAVGDDNPAFRDDTAAREQGFERRPAPLTFTRTSVFPRYRPDGADDVGDIAMGFDLGFDERHRVHGEQEYEFERPVYVGDVLDGTTELVDVDRRESGDGGWLTFATLETVYRDRDGGRVLTERVTLVDTEEKRRA